jgi:hypothetical protein
MAALCHRDIAVIGGQAIRAAKYEAGVYVP